MADVITEHVRAGALWPEAVVDSLSLACHFCECHPDVDYTVTDEAWARFIPSEARRDVVCLPCWMVLAGRDALAHIERVQVLGEGETLVLAPQRRVVWGPVDNSPP